MNRRIFPLVLLAMVLCLASRCQPSTDVGRIRFTSVTRGYHKEVNITKDSVHTLIQGRDGNETYSRHLAAGEWEKLTGALKNVTLQEIPKLKSPTDKRAYDGARISSLELQTSKGQTLIHSFDNEQPHATLKPLMEAVLAVEAKKP
jgi:hypothetical protein